MTGKPQAKGPFRESDMRELIRRYVAAYNLFDIDGMLAVLSRDVRFENYSGGQQTCATTGIEAFRALAESSSARFVEREQTIERLAFSERAAMADIKFRARFVDDRLQGSSAGTVVLLSGQSEFLFDAGKISRIVDWS